nr:hypothetical protein [Tanacetum cinerariifolium]
MVLYGMVSDKYKLERATGIGLGLWSDLRTLITAKEDRDVSIIWDDQNQWEIQSWRLYPLRTIHALETEAGDIIYMEYMRTFVKNQSTAIYTTWWTWKDVRGLTDDQLQNVYNKIRRAVDLATVKTHHHHFKRSGDTLESSESKKLKYSHSTEQPTELQKTPSVSAGATIAAGDVNSDVPSVFAVLSDSTASSVPAETPIAADVSTTTAAAGS